MEWRAQKCWENSWTTTKDLCGWWATGSLVTDGSGQSWRDSELVHRSAGVKPDNLAASKVEVLCLGCSYSRVQKRGCYIAMSRCLFARSPSMSKHFIGKPLDRIIVESHLVNSILPCVQRRARVTLPLPACNFRFFQPSARARIGPFWCLVAVAASSLLAVEGCWSPGIIL